METKRVPSKPVDGFRTKFFSHVALILNNSYNLGYEYCYANKGSFDKADC